MAIIQSRMIALINAAIDYQHALEQLIRIIRTEDVNIRKGLQTAEGAMLNLAIIADENTLLGNAALSQSTISQEHYHFKRNARRNEQERKYQEKKRGGVTEKEHFVPHYATEELSALAQHTTAFRAKGQNQRGDIPKRRSIEYILGGLSDAQKRAIDAEIEKNFDPLSNIIPKGKDPFESSEGEENEE